jgi:hypothetical protein
VVASLTDRPQDGPCVRGVSDDGEGTFLLGTFLGTSLGPLGTSYSFFRIDGGTATRTGGTTGGGDETGVLVFSQPSGFSSFVASGETGASVLQTWSHEGASVAIAEIAAGEQSASRMPSSSVGVDPSGGTAAVKTYFTDDKGWITTYQRFDKNGVAETGEVQIDTGEHRVGGVGVALSGHALILTSVANQNWEARWVARDGSPIAGPFTLQGPAGPKFQFLVDGSLALGFPPFDFSAPASSFVSRIEDGGTAAGPLPEWLAPRAPNQLYVVRSGKAYATWGSGGQCGGDLEILATSGKSCGCVKVPNLSASASVGRDGSLIVPHPPGTPGCSYDLYQHLLR